MRSYPSDPYPKTNRNNLQRPHPYSHNNDPTRFRKRLSGLAPRSNRKTNKSTRKSTEKNARGHPPYSLIPPRPSNRQHPVTRITTDRNNQSLLSKKIKDPGHKLHNMLPKLLPSSYRTRNQLEYPLPKCRTKRYNNSIIPYCLFKFQ